MSWEQAFHDPLVLPDGRQLRTLRDAGHYIQELPMAAQDRPEWQAAAKALLLVVECNGDPLLAYIGVMRALNAGKLLEPKPARKKATKKYRVVR